MKDPLVCGLLCGMALLSPPAACQCPEPAASPEMARLARALAGDWNTEEIVQHGKPVPAGAGRRGTIHVRLAGGGTALVSEGHSAGAVGGELNWLITIWWERDAKRYRFLACFQAGADSGCDLRGTGYWEDDDFVNDYEDLLNGKRVRMQDRWTEITPTSHTLTALVDSGKGVMTPYVVSLDTRR